MIGNILVNIQSVVVFLVVLSILIIVHEWGHFITAKRLGVDVQRFALGFGPTLYSKVYNGTTYMINAIPLGGYVKMAGDDRTECTGASGEFYSKPVGYRSLVVLNGPVINFFLAYFSFILVFMIGYPGQSTTITELVAGGPAVQQGGRPGRGSGPGPGGLPATAQGGHARPGAQPACLSLPGCGQRGRRVRAW